VTDPGPEVTEDPPSDLPARVADLLESITTRIRAMTVDRVARAIKWITLGMVGLTMVAIAFGFLLFGLFRIANGLLLRMCDCGYSMELAYAILGGLFLLLGAFLWRKRLVREGK
jgi:hypothetical protein